MKDSGHGGRPPHASHAQTAAITAIRARSTSPCNHPPHACDRHGTAHDRHGTAHDRHGTAHDRAPTATTGHTSASRRGAEVQYPHDRSRASTQPAARQRRRSTTPA